MPEAWIYRHDQCMNDILVGLKQIMSTCYFPNPLFVLNVFMPQTPTAYG